jgi:hypothetical protein
MYRRVTEWRRKRERKLEKRGGAKKRRGKRRGVERKIL